MADDSEAWPEREGRKRTQPAWMQDHELDAEAKDEDGDEAKARRAPKPKVKAAPVKLSVTCGPRKPAVDTRGRKDVANASHTTKEERALMMRYAQLRALLDAQASSVGNPRAQSAEQAQNAQRMAAAVAALKQDTQADEHKTPVERKLPSMRRSNWVGESARAPERTSSRDTRDEQAPQLDLAALWPDQAAPPSPSTGA